MIKFTQKQYSEYDAMKPLYEQMKRIFRRGEFEVISSSSLIPILKGNNIVIERFVISHPIIGGDRFRMYLKIGSKCKLPDKVRLAGSNTYNKKLGDLSLTLRGSLPKKKLYSNGGGGGDFLQTEVRPYISFNKETTELLGDVLDYNKQDRSLILEFRTIDNAIRSLTILPFGIDYKLYLLNA